MNEMTPEEKLLHDIFSDQGPEFFNQKEKKTMKVHISHGAGDGPGTALNNWFVVLPLPGRTTTSIVGTLITHEMAVESLRRAGRTILEVELPGEINFGYGDRSGDEGHSVRPDFITEERYVDMVQEFSRRSNVYSDFEGFASNEHTQSILDHPAIRMHLEGAPSAVRDLLAHYVYENEDQGDYEVTPEDANTFVDIVTWLLNSRYWLKVDAE